MPKPICGICRHEKRHQIEIGLTYKVLRRLQVEMNRPRNALATPSLPLTYTPPETRGGQ